MRTINVYLTKDQREQLKKIMAKNHVSTTTICDKVSFITFKYLTNTATFRINAQENILISGYMQKTTGIKTSIKTPKSIKQNILFANHIKGHESMYISNAIYLYLTKEIKNYLNENGLKQYYEEINDMLQQAKEQFYNYNSFIRSTRRAIRENKEYYKKAIAQEEGKK